jgi:hypothetical protein
VRSVDALKIGNKQPSGCGVGEPSVVAGTLVELEMEADGAVVMAVVNVWNDSGSGDTQVTRSAGIRRANRSSLEFGVPMYLDSVSQDARPAGMG